MQDKHLYEYAIIRVVPRVERAEFFNAGVLVYSKSTNYLACVFSLQEHKLFALDPEADLQMVLDQLERFLKIANGEKQCGSTIALVDKASRFRWLSANRSTILQCSPIHPGYASDLDAEIQKLLMHQVL